MIIGRKKEREELWDAYASPESEFVAVIGRRRIGKTFLVRKTFNDNFAFKYTGLYNVSNKEQLKNFFLVLKEYGLPMDAPAPKDWLDAFALLKKVIEASSQTRKVVFIDELPWMAAPNSRFLQAFEAFWNGWASARGDVLLIICGSATSWIINNIFRSKGGLYNRVTYRIRLNQFSLAECEEYAEYLNLPFDRRAVLQGYMVMGGVPFYWSKCSPRKGIIQNINDLFLSEQGMLRDEFRYLYASMFSNPDKYELVMETLSGKQCGMTRDDIIKNSGLESNGQLSKILDDLTECGFIRKYCDTTKKLKDAIYQVVDCFTIFHYKWITKAAGVDQDYWMKLSSTPAYAAWCGLAFERVCLLHSRQIKFALGISGISSQLFSWTLRANDEHPGAQIDLLLDRSDNMVNICEMKYSNAPYNLTAEELRRIETRVELFRRFGVKGKAIQPVLITSSGVEQNKYSRMVPLQITADDLFRE